MKLSAAELEEKRQALVERSAIERAQISAHGAALRSAAQVIDKVRTGLYYFRTHPATWVLPAAAVLIWRPRRLLSLGLSVFSAWRFLQQNRMPFFRR